MWIVLIVHTHCLIIHVAPPNAIVHSLKGGTVTRSTVLDGRRWNGEPPVRIKPPEAAQMGWRIEERRVEGVSLDEEEEKNKKKEEKKKHKEEEKSQNTTHY